MKRLLVIPFLLMIAACGSPAQLDTHATPTGSNIDRVVSVLRETGFVKDDITDAGLIKAISLVCSELDDRSAEYVYSETLDALGPELTGAMMAASVSSLCPEHEAAVTAFFNN